MLYEPYPAKKKKKKKRGCLSRLIRLCFVALVAFALWMVGTNALLNLGTLGGSSLSAHRDLPSGWTNILLLGSDTGAQSNRTDTIMIGSIGSDGSIKLTSIMRDTMVSMGEHGLHKMNAAYAYGGEALAMKTINEAFHMNITKYAVVNFASFPPIIDAIGGIRLNVTKAEMEQINQNMRSAGRAVGVRADPANYLKEYGKNTQLTGDQALGYARIRMLDSDYMRAQRQREVLNALMTKARATKNPATLFRLAETILRNVDTNINIAELAALAVRVIGGSGSMEQFRIPVEGAYTSGTVDGVWRIDPDLPKNAQLLYDFIYP